MFKYQTYFEDLKLPCPPQDYIPDNRIAFRWIFEDTEEEDNFKPMFFKNPKRFNEKSEAERCMSMGLSFFKDLEPATTRFLQLKKRLGGESYKILGSQIVRGILQETDGVHSAVDRNGHFTHHPSIDFNFHKNMIIVKHLK